MRLNRHLRACLVLLILTLAAPAPAGVLRVLSWNIEWFPGREPNPEPANQALHMRRAQKAIAGLNPDLLLAQEIAGWPAFAELTSAVPGLQPHVVSAFLDSPTQQVAIASRLQAESAWAESWRPATDQPPRGFAFAAFPLPDQTYLLVWTLHMKANRGDLLRALRAREEAARQLESHIIALRDIYQAIAPVRILIAGDWNTSLDDERFQYETTLRRMSLLGLDWAWASIPFSRRVTLPASGIYPDACFDHAFTHGLTIRSVRAPAAFPEVSDHRPVLLEIEPLDRPAPWTARLPEEASAQWPPISQRGTPLAPPPPPTVSSPSPGRTRSPTANALAASDAAAITARVGKKTTVRGVVDRIGTLDSAALTFINFEGIARGGFVAIVRRHHLPAIEKALGGPLATVLAGREIEVRGDVHLYGTTPQIEIERATDIHFISR